MVGYHLYRVLKEPVPVPSKKPEFFQYRVPVMEPVPGMVGYHLYRVLKEPDPVSSIENHTRFRVGYGTGSSKTVKKQVLKILVFRY
ncbi:hypothetical protein Hanom_Chr07g00636551 [Helianthus anomalus]